MDLWCVVCDGVMRGNVAEAVKDCCSYMCAKACEFIAQEPPDRWTQCHI